MPEVTPLEVLGEHAAQVAPLVISTAAERHRSSAEAHEVSGSRYGMGYGTLWRDLLDDVAGSFEARGYRTYRLRPGGYRVPIVNDCLIYVWRVPSNSDESVDFASSPTRKSGFTAAPPHPMLFDPALGEIAQTDKPLTFPHDLATTVHGSPDAMPLILVMVHSSPHTLLSIEWAVAALDEETHEVTLHGRVPIWLPDSGTAASGAPADSFDSGTPVEPLVAPRTQEALEHDA